MAKKKRSVQPNPDLTPCGPVCRYCRRSFDSAVAYVEHWPSCVPVIAEGPKR
jgi:hypothetical protein